MISQAEVSKIAYREGVSDRTIEKDYVIGWILLGVANSKLKEILAFKGGTALRKIYVSDYRYSEDIDFTLLSEISSESLISDFKSVLTAIEKEVALTLNVSEERIERRTDSLTLYVEFVGPLLAKLGKRDIKVDFTLKEKIIFPLEEKPIITPYSDSRELSRLLKTYSLDEILTEKLCALIGRTEPRDLYDTHFLFELGALDYFSIKSAFPKKAESKEKIDYRRLPTVLLEREDTLKKLWEIRLKHQIKELPHFEKVLRETKQLLKRSEII